MKTGRKQKTIKTTPLQDGWARFWNWNGSDPAAWQVSICLLQLILDLCLMCFTRLYLSFALQGLVKSNIQSLYLAVLMDTLGNRVRKAHLCDSKDLRYSGNGQILG